VKRVDEWLAGVLRRELDETLLMTNTRTRNLLLCKIRCDRTLLQLHLPGGSYSDGNGSYDAGQYCGACGSGEPYTYPVTWPCETLRVVAYSYRWALGYREEWLPKAVASPHGL
jgi:hypothetical protein